VYADGAGGRAMAAGTRATGRGPVAANFVGGRQRTEHGRGIWGSPLTGGAMQSEAGHGPHGEFGPRTINSFFFFHRIFQVHMSENKYGKIRRDVRKI
jgi:hypothetical protein